MGKHLAFYCKALEQNSINADGLCGVANAGLINKQLLELFIPNEDDVKQLVTEGQLLKYVDVDLEGYWASGVELGHPERYRGFTTLRQTIILFMAAINNEL